MLKAERISCSDPKLSDAQTRNFEAIKHRRGRLRHRGRQGADAAPRGLVPAPRHVVVPGVPGARVGVRVPGPRRRLPPHGGSPSRRRVRQRDRGGAPGPRRGEGGRALPQARAPPRLRGEVPRPRRGAREGSRRAQGRLRAPRRIRPRSPRRRPAGARRVPPRGGGRLRREGALEEGRHVGRALRVGPRRPPPPALQAVLLRDLARETVRRAGRGRRGRPLPRRRARARGRRRRGRPRRPRGDDRRPGDGRARRQAPQEVRRGRRGRRRPRGGAQAPWPAARGLARVPRALGAARRGGRVPGRARQGVAVEERDDALGGRRGGGDRGRGRVDAQAREAWRRPRPQRPPRPLPEAALRRLRARPGTGPLRVRPRVPREGGGVAWRTPPRTPGSGPAGGP